MRRCADAPIEVCDDTPLALLGFTATPHIFTVLTTVELIATQLPKPLAIPCRCNSARVSCLAASGVTRRRGADRHCVALMYFRKM